MNLFNNKQVSFEQHDRFYSCTQILRFNLRIAINKACKNNVSVQRNSMATALTPVIVTISLLPEIYDLLSKIKVSYLNDRIYVNRTSKFFLTNFNTDYYQLPEVTIKGKRVFSYDERYSMFAGFRHHIGIEKVYKIDDLEKIISLRVALLEQYLLETKHPAFIKKIQ